MATTECAVVSAAGRTFDHETDVLVVGFGCAGGAAAIEAREAGAEVIILERFSGPGGSSAQSGGELYLGGGTRLQQAAGFDDNADEMYKYLVAALGPYADEEKIRAYCDGSVELFDWLESIGVAFEGGLYDQPSWLPHTTDGLAWLGENAWPYNTFARVIPRGHRPAKPFYGGKLVMDAMVARAAEIGVRTDTDTRAVNLVLDGDRVVGVVARHFGEEVSYRARKGVILTTGGFVDNPEMVEAHVPILKGHGTVSDGGDDGSGIRMAQMIGAAVRRMGDYQLAMSAIPGMACRGMIVNGHGQRFHNEDTYPGMWSKAAALQPGPCLVILDEEGYEDMSDADTWGRRPDFVAETLEELEEETGLPKGSLQHTVAEYNANARKGEDPVFHKAPKWLRELKSPFAAFDPRRGMVPAGEESVNKGDSGFAGFTLGGLHTTVDGNVLDVSGEPIPGLFAAGRAASSMHGAGYVSGTSVGDGAFFGRRAGQSAARESA